MTITELIAELEEIRAKVGDVPTHLRDFDRYGEPPKPEATPTGAGGMAVWI